jgi:hypothetical protein
MGSANDRVLIFDATLRDGEQSPSASMNLEEKREIALLLEEMGVDVIEGLQRDQGVDTGRLGQALCARAQQAPRHAPESGAGRDLRMISPARAYG